MTVTNDLWDHGPKTSTATFRHLTLTVTGKTIEGPMQAHSTLWVWEVLSTTDGSKLFSRAIDRIGACAEAEEAAAKMVRAVFVEHGIVEEEVEG